MTFAVYLGHYPIHSSPPLLNLLSILAERGRVTVYAEGIKPIWPEALLAKGVRFELCGRSDPPLSAPPPDRHISIDPLGIRLCQQLSPGARMIHYSLELYVRGDIHCEPGSVERSLEFRHLIQALIIQSPDRARVFLREYGLPADLPLLLLPITFEEPAEDSRSDYLRKRYGIRPDQRIALHFGETCGKYNVLNLARAFQGLDAWVAVFHGYALPAFRERFLQAIRRLRLDNVIVSEEFCRELRDTYRIIASADVGLAWYNPVTVNLATAGRSSGKIAAYLRRGIPVIGNRTPSMIEALEESGCGIAVKREAEIPAALDTLAGETEGYRLRALETYRSTHHFPVHADRLWEFLCA